MVLNIPMESVLTILLDILDPENLSHEKFKSQVIHPIHTM